MKQESNHQYKEIEREIHEQSRRIVFGPSSEHIRTAVNPQREYAVK